MQDFEKLGVFYLGRIFDRERQAALDDLLLYDSRDLTTHAVCVGMTGSGKTGLCISLLEEAALDGVPALVIDPKGDLGNLLLTFPDLAAADFRPWIDESEASRRGLTPDAHAAQVAAAWRDGLAGWGQGPERIAALRDACEMAIYTPGSNAGRPVRLLRSLSAPPPALLDDPDLLREKVSATVSGLLALVGIAADPVRSREHILLATIIERAWRDGRDLELATLIREVQSPLFDRLGVLDLESFFPSRERRELSMTLNNLLAAPGFGAWMEGEPLDIAQLLYAPGGKPRLAIFSIAHLSDAERMFFVTMLLNEVVAWMRTQAGTASLRALLYMDEVFGYLPPTASPPSKLPMLTLLKQARAYGLGLVLATQNPVDLDYKALSNAGTWFIGRLQTERDRERMLDGLESAAAGARWSRTELGSILSGLGSRVFFMNDVHEDAPVVFQTRWAMSYLRGPLTRQQIRQLSDSGVAATAAVAGGEAVGAAVAGEEGVDGEAADGEAAATVTAGLATPASSRTDAVPARERPPVPPEIVELFAAPLRGVPRAGRDAGRDVGRDAGRDVGRDAGRLVYRPALLATGRLHYVRAAHDVDTWREVALRLALDAETEAPDWEDAEVLATSGRAARDGRERLDLAGLTHEPEAGIEFATAPAAALRAASYARWNRQLVQHLYRSQELVLHRCRALQVVSGADESLAEFQARIAQLAREQRDLGVERLRKRYAAKLARLEERMQRAELRVEREQSQYEQQKLQAAISIGATILGGLFGRKVASARSVGRATTAARGMGRAARERGDIARAGETVAQLEEQLAEVERELTEEIAAVRDAHAAHALELETIEIRPRKSDIQIERLALVWMPWSVDGSGIAGPAWL